MPRIIRIAGVSGSGKTTLIQQLLSECRKLGISTACLKHSHHDLDLPSKDSTHLFNASSDGSMVIGGNAVSVTLPLDIKPPQEWADFLFPNTDLIVVEGWRKFDLPTLLLSTELPEDWKMPKTIVATLGKHHFLNIPCYADSNAAISFILQHIQGSQYAPKKQ